MGRQVDEVYPQLVTCVYSGTAMLNRVVQRKGLDVGLIVNKGFEHIHSMGRAIQSYLGYALEERLHLNSHRYDQPLVPLERTRGVTERTDVLGKVVIPLREDEVREAVRDLVEQRSKAIVICLLQSHKNPESERRARDLAREELDALGSDIPVFASVDYYPSRKESHRINTTILEAYAAEPSRQTLKKVSDRLRKHGARFDLRVMATHGGTISWKAKELARTIVSGPIGGVIGSKLLGAALGYENIACSDIGGTSFDMALITKGNFASPPIGHGTPSAIAAAGGNGLGGRRHRQLRATGSIQRLDQARPRQRRLPGRHLLAAKRAGYCDRVRLPCGARLSQSGELPRWRDQARRRACTRAHQAPARRSAGPVSGRRRSWCD
jgi:N-methylhydantoinase A/oxoprolinase/acetone carboxylase beta subunit